ncbi:hypothetical protein [Rhodopirellula bahusiensis]|uniref:Uncharacterized protein n=1 Tax=Rhodopirellula bahusiensis TaxID=2014065 RepID=A0A2G1W8N6_9BACT|nr:hypothetical protein [Rhodopirellula bahusiensis]PHQ35378.1 hypothetical protein CEE69_10210 [Rhodopirellula bahusiensis]
MLIGKTMNPTGSNHVGRRCKRERLARWLTQAVVWGGCIAASQVAGNTALADETATAKLPPIRLVSGTVQSNPFVERSASQAAGASAVRGDAAASNVNLIQTQDVTVPGGQTVLYPIRQTSDQTLSEIKLKSIGTAVGLLPIGAPATQQTPLVVEPARVPQPRINPHAQPDYDRAESGGIVELTPARVSTEVEPKQTEVQWQQPKIASQPSPVIEQEAVTTEAVVQTPVIQTPVAPQPAVVEPAAPMEEPIVAVVEESEPIEFSLNDATDSESDNEAVTLSFSDSDEASDTSDAGESVTMPEPMKIAVPTKIAAPVESTVQSTLPQLPKPVQIKVPSEMMAQHERHLPVKIDSPTQLERVDSERMLNAPARHRAAVAVEAPPMVAIAKQTKSTSSESRVHATRIVPAALASHRGGFQRSTPVADSEPSLPIDDTIVCDANDVTSLTVDGVIEAVRVEDDSIARVISSTSRHLRLIGVRPGKTRVLVQQKVAGKEGSVREIYELHIAPPSDVRGGESQQEQSLMELIEQKYRTASVQVTRRGDRIIVQGECDDTRDAKEIVRLIRKTYLVPVEDQLILR